MRGCRAPQYALLMLLSLLLNAAANAQTPAAPPPPALKLGDVNVAINFCALEIHDSFKN